ncbi:MAG: hypothetical protein HYX55_06525 [Chloroflexi bacterium]|nr:hypothetical protein [Chloroflexota bacterium]
MAGPAPRHFPIRVERRYRLLLRIFGVRPENAWVDLGETLEAGFGWSHLSTPISNCVRWSIEGPWRAITALGVRMSIRHGDITFGGTPRGGVRIDFREPVRYWRLRPPALYLTVEDLEGFAAALSERGIPGEDRRTTR